MRYDGHSDHVQGASDMWTDEFRMRGKVGKVENAGVKSEICAAAALDTLHSPLVQLLPARSAKGRTERIPGSIDC